MSTAAPQASDLPQANTTSTTVPPPTPVPTNLKTSSEALNPLVTSVIAFLIINTFIFVARAVSRRYIAKLSFWWDDLCIVVGYVVLVAMGAVALIIVRIEVSGSKWDVEVSDLDELTKLAKLIYAYLLLLTASFAATRFAILALYLRIFQNTKLRRVIWMAIVFVALQNTAVMLVSVFSCWPVSNFWTPTTWPHAVCINRDAFYRSMTPINIAVDAALVVLPLPTVWHLKATRFRKWALTFVFGLGSLALIISAVRLVMILTNKNGVMPSPSNTNSLFIWIYIEPSVYLVAACLPTMHHIVAAVTPKMITRWAQKKMSWLSRLAKSAPSRGSLNSEAPAFEGTCSAHEFNPYVGNDEPLEGLGQEAKVEAVEMHVVENGQRLSQIDGIMVTQEFKIIHEDRIASVIGF